MDKLDLFEQHCTTTNSVNQSTIFSTENEHCAKTEENILIDFLKGKKEELKRKLMKPGPKSFKQRRLAKVKEEILAVHEQYHECRHLELDTNRRQKEVAKEEEEEEEEEEDEQNSINTDRFSLQPLFTTSPKIDQCELSGQFQTPNDALLYLRNRGILRPTPPNCIHCGLYMTAVKDGHYRNDQIVWRCTKHKGAKISVRKGSVIEKQNISMVQFILLVQNWARMRPVVGAAESVGLNKATVVQWYQLFRNVCSWWLTENPIQLGGPGIVVQIYETLVAERKCNRAGQTIAERWVMGMYDCARHLGVLKFVDDISGATLLPIVLMYVLPGTEIHSNMWAVNNQLANYPVSPPYVQQKVNQSGSNIADLAADTDNVQRFWLNMKEKLKRMNGAHTDTLPGHLDEFCWRQFHAKQPNSAFDNMLAHISLRYPTS